MYAKRVQIVNYGPINQLDITLPFDNDVPKPMVLVGENGSGKSIMLSHIVNGLVSAKGMAYPETPEVETDKVYKLRSSSYIMNNREFYFGRVDFQDNLHMAEMRTRLLKQQYEIEPLGIDGDIKEAWNDISANSQDYLAPNIYTSDENDIRDVFSKNCVLYFPSNRFEEPAWLNRENLTAAATYVEGRRISGHTNRKIISEATLKDNQNWLFDVIYRFVRIYGQSFDASRVS